MFSATLGVAPEPSRRVVLAQLGLLNVAALLVVGGRTAQAPAVLATGAVVFAVVVGWVTWQVDRLWRRRVNPRFRPTGTFYRLAGLSVLGGAMLGGALGIGAFGDAAGYVEHREIHMALNVLGWAGLSTVGTAVTLLPTVLHVRAPRLGRVTAVPWLLVGGLLVFAGGTTVGSRWGAATGMAAYAVGLALFGRYLYGVVTTPRRRKVPAAAFHLVAALVWLGVTTVTLTLAAATGDHVLAREAVVVGGAAGFVFQALLGAWTFLVPSLRRVRHPEQRRRELTASDLGGRVQAAAYNAGLLAFLVAPGRAAAAGAAVAVAAAAWGLAKTWAFRWLAHLPPVVRRSDRWWADPEA
jgi:nitrite reductase (NO-forming)